ncbi:hypothetical protein QTL97_14900 [Sporosarcina thermotolerans]|uniref:Uncharacterized protein n=1 Tax=Sporosarcina thermotolerans TaxID=633404 RepID=A0AAW9ADE1_9BACL|nr:hypothetical protein [Sporosarcina thermotolerans]MDW0118219.1 hypothetical protein [Sporosarcina thermotolerans]WHT48531.1 hypothetical protein QNH10_01445 [Sporosarcina thermotolerans]
MATKSRSDWSIVLSIVSICIAAISIGYCFPHVIELALNGWERSTRAIAYFSRIIKGGAS